MNNQPVLFKRLHPEARTPVQATAQAAGFDLTSIGVEQKNGMFIVSTGLATAFPEGYVLLIYGRSGYAFKYGISLANGVGVIDADYRGEIKLAFKVPALCPYHTAYELLDSGNRVAQGILMPIPAVEWTEVKELPESVRGAGGFGSTGLR